jgi:hypothetical protein
MKSLSTSSKSAVLCSSRLEIFYHSSIDGSRGLSAELGNP